ncbi:MAG TPA: DUF4870 domain-containing protein [Flavobacteriaceae bacterium]|nr:DUF4870 domain-containing protein [Flavobacteriaceae bacterium]HEX5743818.1 DUF4870 domain-containing protein [Flavobacteriaceae bacterium]
MTTNNEKNSSFLIHLSAFSGYFLPLGSVLVPLIIWNLKKEESEFIDQHGKEAVNFNLSFLLYYLVLFMALFPIFFKTIFNMVTHMEHMDHFESMNHMLEFGGWFSIFGIILLFGTMSIFKFIVIILAAVKAQQGAIYNYPLRIKFIK